MSELAKADEQVAKGSLTKTQKEQIDAQTDHIMFGKYTVPDDQLSRDQAKRHKKMNENRIAPSFR